MLIGLKADIVSEARFIAIGNTQQAQ